MAAIIGDVTIGAKVMVSPQACIRADEGTPFLIDEMSNVQDGVVIHALEAADQQGNPIEERLVECDGNKYAVYIGKRVSLAHQSQVHGPAYIGNDTFIAMQSLVFNARVGKGCVLEPKSGVIGVNVPDGRYVPAGVVVTDQQTADSLPEIYEGYPYVNTNKAVVKVNIDLAEGYKQE